MSPVRRLLPCLFPLAIALLAATTVLASGGATCDAGELDLPVDAAAAAFGTAASGLVDGTAAVFTAPARIGAGAPMGVAATYVSWMTGVSDSSVAIHKAGAGLGSLGLALRYFRSDLRYSSEDGRGFFGNEGGIFYYENLRVAAALSPDLASLLSPALSGLHAGVSGFVIKQDAAEMDTRYGYGINAQAEYRPDGALAVCAEGRNIGVLKGRPLPLGFAAGLEARIGGVRRSGGSSDRLAGAAEFRWSRQNGVGGSIAAEYSVEWEVLRSAIRAGWAVDTVKSASLFPTCGLAFRIANLSIEAGLVFQGDLGTAQVISLGWESRKEE